MRLSPIFCTVTAILLGYTSLLQAAERQTKNSLSFSHKDWSVDCDNTRTCRVTGYQRDADEMLVSVLLTRHAGANQAVSAQVQIGENEQIKKMPSSLRLRINGENLGNVSLAPETAIGDLEAKQVAALLAVLGKKAEITWSAGKQTWELSDEGAAAVLLKMDEFQGRLGTVGALLRKGNQDESKVLPALPAPQIPAVATSSAKLVPLTVAQQNTLKAELIATVKDGDLCPNLSMPELGQTQALEFAPLSANKRVVTTSCWSAAYNFGTGVWIINHQAPFAPVLVTADASEYSKGKITSAQKGRGLGDCWGRSEKVWNGKQFVDSHISNTGLCKGFPGGAWELPTLVSEIIPAKP